MSLSSRSHPLAFTKSESRIPLVCVAQGLKDHETSIKFIPSISQVAPQTCLAIANHEGRGHISAAPGKSSNTEGLRTPIRLETCHSNHLQNQMNKFRITQSQMYQLITNALPARLVRRAVLALALGIRLAASSSLANREKDLLRRQNTIKYEKCNSWNVLELQQPRCHSREWGLNNRGPVGSPGQWSPLSSVPNVTL